MKIFLRSVLIVLDIFGGMLGVSYTIINAHPVVNVTNVFLYIMTILVFLLPVMFGVMLLLNKKYAITCNKILWFLQIARIDSHFISFGFIFGPLLGMQWNLTNNILFYAWKAGSQIFISIDTHVNVEGKNPTVITINFVALIMLLSVLYIQSKKNFDNLAKEKNNFTGEANDLTKETAGSEIYAGSIPERPSD